jgi:hypothetical protein
MKCTCRVPTTEPGDWHNCACPLWREPPLKPDRFQAGGRALALPGSTEQRTRQLVTKLGALGEQADRDPNIAAALLNLALLTSISRVGRAALRVGLLDWLDEQDALEHANAVCTCGRRGCLATAHAPGCPAGVN